MSEAEPEAEVRDNEPPSDDPEIGVCETVLPQSPQTIDDTQTSIDNNLDTPE